MIMGLAGGGHDTVLTGSALTGVDTWLQSAVLVLAAVPALLVGLLLLRRCTGSGAGVWLVLGGGLVALAVDERLALHKMVPYADLAPGLAGGPLLGWVAGGDVAPLLIAAVGLALLPLVWRAVREDRGALWCLVLAVLFALVAIAMDAVGPALWGGPPGAVHVVEEGVELAAGVCLLAMATRRFLSLRVPIADRDGRLRPDSDRTSSRPVRTGENGAP